MGDPSAMPMRFGPGPVFVYESIVAARRWQSYALRVLFVVAFLVGFWIAWRDTSNTQGSREAQFSLNELARLGEQIYFAVAATQIAIVLLVAPAATAGSVCLDRARGGLEHMFVTDLSNVEIVVGKLAARLLPVAALVASGVPVLFLATLLGGIIPEALVTLTVVTASVAVLGCSLALAVSVRATRTHEVLMAVYAFEAFWLLSLPVCLVATRGGGTTPIPNWFYNLNPFVLAYRPYVAPYAVTTSDVLRFLAVTLGIALLAVGFAVVRLRAPIGSRRQRKDRWEALRRTMHDRLFSWWPTPSLDGNPVLWREWHRNRPSRLARTVMLLYIAVTIAGLVLGVEFVLDSNAPDRFAFLEMTNALAVSFGLLILSASAPTALTEERVRGSLDVVMSTPLSTKAIVMGKWWAIYRRWLPLAVVPVFVSWCELMFGAEPYARMSFLPQFTPLTSIDFLACAVLPADFALAHAAAVTSLGLALATWVKRTGPAIALSVAAYLFVFIGGPILYNVAILPLCNWIGLTALLDSLIEPSSGAQTFEMVLSFFSPMAAQVAPYRQLEYPTTAISRPIVWVGAVVILVLNGIVALGLVGLTLATFDRCLGRVREQVGDPRPVILKPVRETESQFE